MTATLTTNATVLDPFPTDWTVEDLLHWIAADDARLSDPALRGPLRAVEEALTGTRWTTELDADLKGARLTREPSIVSLVRSIALHTRRCPAARAMSLAEALES
ncbi:hypothetical protein ACWGJP_07365 [Microbacterium sp. NPDC055903]